MGGEQLSQQDLCSLPALILSSTLEAQTGRNGHHYNELTSTKQEWEFIPAVWESYKGPYSYVRGYSENIPLLYKILQYKQEENTENLYLMQVFFLQSCPSNSNLLVRVYWAINSKYYIYRDMSTASIMFCSFCSSICICLVGCCTLQAMWCPVTHGPVPQGSPYPGCASLIHHALGLALGIWWAMWS